uniref:J domain-containing protein n=1 Tax=Amorphochlora amoebiformis TaxID=1561963 RepID=A0A7S0H0J5_9EUKA|mmetsp:Transcript_24525/g.38644  ORF Transcript_24525/g.38644 Transcript_24525/m.38644 type:complete len:407 (+) Transcript_24525:73-1293(+)
MLGEEARQNAVKCIMVARKYLSQGDLASAKRMALKSKRFQHLPVADALLKQLDDIQNPTSPASPKSTNTSSKHSNSNKRSNHSTRNGAGAGSNSKPQASQRDSGRLGSEESQGEKENVQVRYTASQARIVREVRSEKDYYKLLKIDRSASKEAITKAYRKVAVRCHPDKNPHPKAEEAFKKLSTIKGILTDERKRRTYDRFGEEGVSEAGSRGGGGYRHNRFRSSYGYEGSGYHAFSEDDIFNMFFDTGRRRRRGRQDRAQDDGHPRGFQMAQLVQFLPFVLILLLSFFNQSHKPDIHYSLVRSSEFPVPRTSPSGTEYFVSYHFNRKYSRETSVLRSLDEMADAEYFHKIKESCDLERVVRSKSISAAQRNKEGGAQAMAQRLRQAHNLATPSCFRMNSIIDAQA